MKNKVIIIHIVSILLCISSAVLVYANYPALDFFNFASHSDVIHFTSAKDLQQNPRDYLDVPILMYHHVGDVPVGADAIRHDLTVSTEDFIGQMQWLKASGYTTVRLEEVLQAVKEGKLLPKKSIVITFDDGYQDVFSNAVPVLKEQGFVGSFAIITSFVGTSDYASWETIAQAQKEGMEVVSHSDDHFDGSNPKYSSEFIFTNLTRSKEQIKKHLGLETNVIIYPFGHYTDAYVEAAKKAGFEMGLTVAYGAYESPHSLMVTPRVRVHGKNSIEIFAKNLLDLSEAD